MLDGDMWSALNETTFGVGPVAHNLFDEKAMAFLDKNVKNKFFLYMAYNVPHANNEAGAFRCDGMEVPDYYEFADKDWPQPEKGFAAVIRNIDHSVGMILNKLKALGLDDNTMVIFFVRTTVPIRKGVTAWNFSTQTASTEA